MNASTVTPPKYDRIIGVFGNRFEIGAVKDGRTGLRPDFTDYDLIVKSMGSIPGYSSGKIKFISGGSKGVERLVEQWCRECDVPFERVKPDMVANPDSYSAFDQRNLQIIDKSRELMFLWDGNEDGIDKLMRACIVLGKEVKVYPLKKRA